MKQNFFIKFLVMSFVFTCLADDRFVMPPLDRRYDHVCWLAAHNAYAAERYGYIYANQYYTLAEQLDHGVRQFELDIEKRCWSKTLGVFGDEGCTVSLCHASCELNKWMQPNISGALASTGDPNGFKTTALNLFKDFLIKNPNEILTITIENRVREPGLLDKHIEESGIQNMILKPSDWNPVEQQGWPTLQWMINNNKRLVIFNDYSAQEQGYKTDLPFVSTRYTYYQWATIAQNQWAGAKKIEIALRERDQSRRLHSGYTRYLFELDQFPDGGKILGGAASEVIAKLGGIETPFVESYEKVNGPDLRELLNRVLSNGLDSGICKGRYPNFIKVDYFHEGNPMKLVNEINQLANDPAKRALMFRPIFDEPIEKYYNKAISAGKNPIDVINMILKSIKGSEIPVPEGSQLYFDRADVLPTTPVQANQPPPFPVFAGKQPKIIKNGVSVPQGWFSKAQLLEVELKPGEYISPRVAMYINPQAKKVQLNRGDIVSAGYVLATSTQGEQYNKAIQGTIWSAEPAADRGIASAEAQYFLRSDVQTNNGINIIFPETLDRFNQRIEPTKFVTIKKGQKIPANYYTEQELKALAPLKPNQYVGQAGLYYDTQTNTTKNFNAGDLVEGQYLYMPIFSGGENQAGPRYPLKEIITREQYNTLPKGTALINEKTSGVYGSPDQFSNYTIIYLKPGDAFPTNGVWNKISK